MKIAIVSTMYGHSWGGSEELWALMAEEALKKGLEIAVSIFSWPILAPKLQQLQQLGAKVITRPTPEVQCQRFYRWTRSFRNPFRAIEEFNPDVICISQGGTLNIANRENADLVNFINRCNRPYVVICQANIDGWFPSDEGRSLISKFFAQARIVAFVAEHNLRLAERQLAGSLHNAKVIRNPVNLSSISLLGWPNTSVIKMANVARLDADSKGQDILFEVLGSNKWAQREWQLNLFGEGSHRSYLELLARHYGIASRVNFVGQVSNVQAIWQDNQLLVLPSRYEGTPLALVETMLCGRPAVVTDVGGNSEWIKDAYTGFIAEAPTPKAFGESLERAWQSKLRWKEMGREAYEEALKRYDPTPGHTLLEILKEAIASPLP